MAWDTTYASLADLKSYLKVGSAAHELDDQFDDALVASSRAIDQSTNRQFGLVAANENRVYTAEWDRPRCQWVIEIDDLMTSTGLTVNVDDDDDQVYDQAITSYRLYPFNAPANSRPWTKILVKSDSTIEPNTDEGAVQVYAKYGWTTVPDTIKAACLLQASRLVARMDAPFGVAGSPDVGSEMRLLARLDPDVAVMVSRYKRRWGAV
jgi:hypothetical protein